MSMYHEGNREIQDQFGSRALADRLVERLERQRFKDEDKAFIESVGFFFLATADAEGRPDCSFKGGPVGFVRVEAPDLLVFPDYDGNGMFKSLGNIKINPSVGLLFIDIGEKPRRLRVNGRATLHFDDPAIGRTAGAQIIVRVVPEHIFPNCPRYIPDLRTGEASPYVPCAGAPLRCRLNLIAHSRHIVDAVVRALRVQKGMESNAKGGLDRARYRMCECGLVRCVGACADARARFDGK